MIRHCVMFTWNDGVGDDIKAQVSAGLDRMAKLDMVGDYHHGPDLGVSDGTWHYVVVGDFASVEDYQAYATDPDHRALIAELIAPNISGRAAVQYQL